MRCGYVERGTVGFPSTSARERLGDVAVTAVMSSSQHRALQQCRTWRVGPAGTSCPPLTRVRPKRSVVCMSRKAAKDFSARAAAAAGLTSVLIAGCVGDSVPYGYIHIEDTAQYIPRSRLEAIADRRATRSDVVAEIGSPDWDSPEVNTIGYDRCVTSQGHTIAVLVVPLPVHSSRPEMTSCQRVTIWFDIDGRAMSWDEFTYKWEGGDTLR